MSAGMRLAPHSVMFSKVQAAPSLAALVCSTLLCVHAWVGAPRTAGWRVACQAAATTGDLQSLAPCVVPLCCSDLRLLGLESATHQPRWVNARWGACAVLLAAADRLLRGDAGASHGPARPAPQVLNRYFPPDFDPAKLPKMKKVGALHRPTVVVRRSVCMPPLLGRSSASSDPAALYRSEPLPPSCSPHHPPVP